MRKMAYDVRKMGKRSAGISKSMGFHDMDNNEL
jgi:hypothetical protein